MQRFAKDSESYTGLSFALFQVTLIHTLYLSYEYYKWVSSKSKTSFDCLGLEKVPKLYLREN